MKDRLGFGGKSFGTKPGYEP